MKDFKEYCKDGNGLIKDFCASLNCNACHRSDENGEVNGYGCELLSKEFLKLIGGE